MEIHQLIRTALATKRWKIGDLAATTNVSAATAARWANGAITPKPARWPDIEEALDLPAGRLARAYYGLDANAPDLADFSQLDERYLTQDEARSALDQFARLGADVKALQRRVTRLEAAAAAQKPQRPRRSRQATDG